MSHAVELVRVAPDHNPRQGDLVEWSLKGTLKEWMTTDCARTPVLVIKEGERSWERPAFLYRPHRSQADRHPAMQPTGPAELRIRHTFRKPGVFTWELHKPGSREGVEPLLKGSTAVMPKTGPHGVIHQSSVNPRLLAYADGSPFIPVAINIGWANGPDQLAEFKRLIDAFAQNGGNHIRTWACSWFGQIESSIPQAYRLDHAWLLDQVLAHCRLRGVKVTLVLDNHHDFVEGKAFPYGTDLDDRISGFLSNPPPKNYERRLRYLLARYGADDGILMWELFNEVDLTYAERWRIATWTAGAARLLGRLDPDTRMVTVSTANANWFEVVGSPGIDVVQEHLYILNGNLRTEDSLDAIAFMAAEIPKLNTHKRPFCFSEIGHQGTNENNPGNAADPDGFLLRQQLWAGFMLGGYGSGMNWWWDYYVDQQELWHLYKPFADTVKKINWADGGLRPLPFNPDSELRILGWQSKTQALIWPLHSDDTWYRYLGEGLDRPTLSTTLQLTLQGMQAEQSFAVATVDMVNGSTLEVLTSTSDASGALPLRLPQAIADRVLVITPHNP